MDFISKTKQLVAARAHAGNSDQAKQARAAIKTFADLGHFNDLKVVLSQLTDVSERDGVYWMLESLVRHTGSAEVGQFMMDQVGREVNKLAKAGLLERIGALKVEHAGSFKAKGMRIQDASNALVCLTEKNRKLRTAAIDALGKCSHPRAEAALVEIIDEQLRNPKESGWYLHGAIWSLSEIATPRALPCVLKVIGQIDVLPLKNRKREIKALAVKTIASIGGPRHLNLFCGLLTKNVAPVVKWHAMRALCRYAQKKHVPVIKKRIQDILGSTRLLPRLAPPLFCPDVGDVLFSLSEGDEAKKTELLWAFEALVRLRALKDRDLVQLLRKKWSTLIPLEKAYLEAHAVESEDR